MGVNPKERRWVYIFAITFMLVTTLPYIMGYANAGTDWSFTGFVFGIEDGNSYIAKMLSGAYGRWLFITPYSALPQRGVIAFLPYIFLGKLSSPPGQHEQLVVLFHLFRVLSGVLLIYVTYNFLAIFLAKVKTRRVGVILVSLGGGLGWLLVLIGKEHLYGTLPLEFYSPESFGFLELFGLPHLTLARALLLWGISIYLVGDQISIENSTSIKPERDRKQTPAGVKSGLLFVSLGLVQPLTVVIGWAIILSHIGGLFIWQFYRGKRGNLTNWHLLGIYIKRALWIVGISSPIVMYTVVSFSIDPFLKQWTAQNIILAPHPLHYLFAYGLLLPFVIGGAYFVILDNTWRGWFPIVWVLLLPLFAYSPFNLQRRLAEGVWVAFVILAVKAIEGPSASTLPIFWSKLNGVYRRSAPILILAILSSLFIFAGGIQSVFNVQKPLFRSTNEIEALKFLNYHAKPGEIVLSSYSTGNVIPAWVPIRVVIGHGPESVKFEMFSKLVEEFFGDGSIQSNRLATIKELDVSYIFLGPNERYLGNWDPKDENFLREIYNENGYLIYEVESK